MQTLYPARLGNVCPLLFGGEKQKTMHSRAEGVSLLHILRTLRFCST